jgi:hypothetical protein
MWVENEVTPASDDYVAFLWSFAFRPELPVNHFLYPDGSVEGFRQYGAMLFPRYLSEHVTDATIVRRAWVEAPVAGDPLEVLHELLVEDGLDIEDVYFDFADHAATFDFEHEAWYEENIERVGGWDDEDSHRPTGVIGELSETWLAPPEAERPLRFGTNYWQLAERLPDEVYVEFDGQDGPRWHVAVAFQGDDGHERVEIPLADDEEGGAVVSGLDDGTTEAWIVVSVVDDDPDVDWDYELRVTEPPPDPIDTGGPFDTDDPETPGRACACGGAARAGAWAWIALLGLIGRVRRR